MGLHMQRRQILGAAGLLALSGQALAETGIHLPSMLRGFMPFTEPVRLPDVSLQDADGRETSTGAMQGSPLLINLWATWCGPCIEELPSLRRLADQAEGAFRVVLLNQDRGGAAVANAFLRRLRIEGLQSFSDPQGRISRALSVRGLPTTFVARGNGSLIGRYEGGAQWDAQGVSHYIKHLVQS